MRAVFVEEVQNEIRNLRKLLPAWKNEPFDQASVTQMRRSFHSLKGSSRMVGETAMGDFNAKFERLLDRLIDKTLAPSPSVIEAVEQGTNVLSELLLQLRTGRAPRADVQGLMRTVDRLIKSPRVVVRPAGTAAADDGSVAESSFAGQRDSAEPARPLRPQGRRES
ncbi:Hpt domain-containing protein [Tahibacter amnicola]|uniref:Hpt domain-containing protein n=1 Tax=Tahibacter amnicola TaxID=2976241 RepID=A0ABY6BCJ7_9GAMM|nr:Hpt domain-containing protein [Tahibacter amnicola]UXI66845.1 Hpt domain-containing protein [Tahibacter amnicola]